MVPYMGGKSIISKWIFENMPKKTWERYTEVFGGAFWLFLKRDIVAKEIHYNDFNRFLVNLWTFMVNDRESLLEAMGEIKLNDKETFHANKKFIKEKEAEDWKIPDLEIAAKYVYLLTHCFSGDISGGMKLVQNAWKPFTSKLKDSKYIEKLDQITEIHNKSYVDLVPELDIEGGFFYLDPPYFKKEHLYGFHDFGFDDHKKLSEMLREVKSEWILSYYPYDELEEWYPKKDFVWKSKEYTRSSSAVPGKPGKGVELLIYPREQIQPKPVSFFFGE